MSETMQKQSSQDLAIKQFLRNYLDKAKDEQTMNSILADIGGYYDADRVYIFEQGQDYRVINNTYEWCREGIVSEIDNLQNIPIDDLECYFETFKEQGEFYISSLTEDYFPGSKLYQILQSKGIESLMAAPIMVSDVVVGFLGVDNPGQNTGDLLLLSVAASTSYSEITKNRMMKEKMEQTSKTLMDRMKIIQSMSEIYTAVYYIDMSTGQFSELSSFDNVHTHIGATGDARERLNYFCHHMMLPSYTEEMLEFVDLSTLDYRLRHSRIVTKQYLSTVILSPEQGNRPDWTECCFIEGDRTPDGRLSHVIFATRSIHDAKVKELEAQQILQETNRELTALLTAEKQYTAIIGAMSNVYFAIYYIDLKENSFQELICLDKLHHSLGKKGNAKEALKHMTDELVGTAHQQLMQNFTNLDTIDERLGDKSIIIQEYIARTGGWIRCAFIPVDKTEDGRNRNVLCTLRWITAEKNTMESQDNLIQALAIPYEDIYAIRTDTGEAVCYRMDRAINERYGQNFVTGNYERNMGTYIENDVLQEDRNLFERIRTVSGVNELLTDKKTYYFNYRVSRHDRVQYFQCQLVKPNRDRNEFVIAFKNIDEEKRMELAQQRRIEEALAAVEKINEALQEETEISSTLSREYHSLFKIDAKTGKMSVYRTDGLGMNPETLQKLMELSDYETILNTYIDTFVVPEDREGLRASNNLQVLMELVPDVGLYKQGYRRIMNGIISYYEMNVVKIVGNDETVTFILGMRDVDEEMRRRLKQTREMEKQREIIEGLGSEYYSVLLVNPETDTVITYRAEDEDGLAIAEHFRRYEGCWSKGLRSYAKEQVSEQSRKEFLKKLSLSYIHAAKREYSLTYEKLTDNGITYLQARVAYVHEKDGRFDVVIGTRNVDDLIKKERQQEMALQEAYEAAEAANKAKTDFLSSMSHDIRTPMNGIIGMTAIAMAHLDEKERVRDSLQKITRASNHMLSLINEVLDMSKIESGKVDLVEEEFNLSDLLNNLLIMMNSQIEEHRHSFQINISGLTHDAVIGDSLRIQKVFTNMISNAVKYTPDGGKIGLVVTEKSTNQAKVGCFDFVFEDNGIGMTEEFQKVIFEPFTRAEDGRVNKIQGTGLGMPISRNIVRMMGGDIKVESNPGVGSRFTVTMYLKLQDKKEHSVPGSIGEEEKNIQDEPLAGLGSMKLTDYRALLVEDNELNAEIAGEILGMTGIAVDYASDGTEAVDRIAECPDGYYDIIFMDIQMPQMNGYDATRAIRAMNRSYCRQVPIVAMTANAFAEDVHAAKTVGMNEHIAKPLNLQVLIKTLNRWLEIKKHE